jgi:hypothetical protein
MTRVEEDERGVPIDMKNSGQTMTGIITCTKQ